MSEIHNQNRGGIALSGSGCTRRTRADFGSISGTIADKQGAVISGAKVLLSDQQQGAQRRIVTDAQGNFVFTPIPPST